MKTGNKKQIKRPNVQENYLLKWISRGPGSKVTLDTESLIKKMVKDLESI